MDPSAVVAGVWAASVTGSGLRAPGPQEKVWKDECAFSFATPLSAGGLYVNLATFQAFSAEYVELDHERTGNTLYLHQQWQVRCLAARAQVWDPAHRCPWLPGLGERGRGHQRTNRRASYAASRRLAGLGFRRRSPWRRRRRRRRS